MPKRDPTLTAFGRNVARLRADRGFAQDKLAEKAEIDRTYPLAEAAAAHAYLESRQAVGRVVLIP